MSTTSDKLLEKALHLPPLERAAIADGLLSSLDKPDAEIDKLWAEEVESRIE